MAVMTTYPGVYVEETPNGPRPLEGVSTSVTAFIGACGSGCANHPVHVSSLGEFMQQLGGLVSELELGYSVRQFFLNGGRDAWIVPVTRNADVPQFITAIHSLNEVDLFNLLVLPGTTDRSVLNATTEYCRTRRAFFILDPPSEMKTPAALEQAITSNIFPRSCDAAVYFPWIKIPDPLNNGQLRSISPGGAVAGVIARTDNLRGVWKAPAGTEANLIGITSLDYDVTDAENAALNSRGINCLRVFPSTGPVVWGGRTLPDDVGTHPDYKYIPVRRLALFLEESIFRGTQWAVFEPNGESLWAQIRLSVHAFLMTMFRSGAFQGIKPEEAFFVKCDRETTTSNDVSLGTVNFLVGFAPTKPAEFVILRFSHACH